MSSSSHSSSSSCSDSSASSSTSSQPGVVNPVMPADEARASPDVTSAARRLPSDDATSILEGHVPPEVPLAVFDKTLLGPGPPDLDQLADKLSEPYATFLRNVVVSPNIVLDLMPLLNSISKALQEHYGFTLIEFVEHSHAALLHHPLKSTSMRPSLIAVSSRVVESYRPASYRPETNAIAWHHVLAAVYINGSADDCHLIDRCASFLGALNQARPDMPGSLALTTTRRASCFLWSDAADVYSSQPTAWADSTTLAFLLRFVHRLYKPLAVDRTVKLDSPFYDLVGRGRSCDDHRGPVDHSGEPVWLVSDDKGVEYRIAAVLHVGRPWTHRNWVAVSTQCRAAGAEDFVDCPRKVVKDCWSKIAVEDIAESAILQHIHADGDFPGVCRVLSSFHVPGHEGAEGLQSVQFPDLRVEGRRKHRMVLDGGGKDLYTCASIVEFLMVMYDVIDVLRRLHEYRGVLHRDISIRNVLLAPVNAGGQGDSKTVRDILAYKYPAVRAEQGPRCVLIDFDNAFWKGKMSDSSLQSAVGTPAFVARSVGREFRLSIRFPPCPIPELDGHAKECYIRAYGEDRYRALSTLHDADEMLHGEPPEERRFQAPRHDVESCFFVILHFFLTALPAGADTDDENVARGKLLLSNLESYRMGDISDPRLSIFQVSARNWPSCLHPSLRGFSRLLATLSSHVEPIYELCKEDPPAYHLHEAMQRVLLDEICRVLDAREDVALNTHRRRAVGSVYDSSPLWLLLDQQSRATNLSTRKRPALSLVRSSGGLRRRLEEGEEEYVLGATFKFQFTDIPTR